MTRLLYQKKAVALPTKLLIGLALLFSAPFAAAQNNLGELLGAGAKRVSGEEFKRDVVERTLVGPTASGASLEFMYATSGVIQGRSQSDAAGKNIGPPVAVLSSLDGAWNIDDSGRICTSMVVGRIILPFRCQYWFRLKDDYFIADSDSDTSAKVLRRTVKQ
jgi:hypothetical protein